MNVCQKCDRTSDVVGPISNGGFCRQCMSTSHTPGPWTDDNERDNYDFARVVRHNGVVVARISEPTAGLSVDEVDANAHLIAAAPTMYDALVIARDYIASITPVITEPEQADDKWAAAFHAMLPIVAAIAKARNEGVNEDARENL